MFDGGPGPGYIPPSPRKELACPPPAQDHLTDLAQPSRDCRRCPWATRYARQTTLLVRGNAPVIDPAWESSEVGLEEMVLAYMGQDAAPAISDLTSVGEEQ